MNCGKNVRLKPTKMMRGADLGERFVVEAAADLRPPVVQAAEISHDRAADHDVVEVRDDEVGVGDVDVQADRGEEEPGQPADREQPDEADRRRASASPTKSTPCTSSPSS